MIILRVASMDKMIEQLELLEKVDDLSEYYKNNVIAYLKNFVDYLNRKNVKTVKEKCPGAATPDGHR